MDEASHLIRRKASNDSRAPNTLCNVEKTAFPCQTEHNLIRLPPRLTPELVMKCPQCFNSTLVLF